MDQKLDFFAHSRAARRADADLLGPDALGFVILGEHRDPEALLRNAERAGDEIPREMNRLALEIVAEAEIAEHLEERVVPGGVADVFQIIVLAAGAHAALRARRARIVARLLAEKHVLELHHARHW